MGEVGPGRISRLGLAGLLVLSSWLGVSCGTPDRYEIAWRVPDASSAEALLAEEDTPLALTEEPRHVAFQRASRPGVVRPFGEDRRLELPPLDGCEQLELSVGSSAGSSALRIEIGSEADGGAIDRVFSSSVPATLRGSWQRFTLPLELIRESGADHLMLRAESQTASWFDRVVWGQLECLASNPPETGRPDERAPDVLFVILDTLRADRMSAYGYERPTTPFLERWARDEAVLFEQVVAAAPWTLPSTTSMFTGLDATRHGINRGSAVSTDYRLLPEVLHERGYRTGAITAGGYLLPQYGFAQGFDSFESWQGDPAQELTNHLAKAKDWLGEHRDERFFFLFHTYEIHGPHRRRRPFFETVAPPEALALDGTRIQLQGHEWGSSLTWTNDTLVAITPDGVTHETLDEAQRTLAGAMYDSAIAYTDAALEDLFETLEDLGLYDDLLIVVTSDHGEALGEDGRGGHNYLDDYNLMVPLMIRLPDGRGAGLRIREQVRQIDVAPTLLDALGLWDDRPLGPTDGRSLLPAIESGRATGAPEAWSYASSANGGLTLRYAGRWKAWINNMADRRLLGRGRVQTLDGHESPSRSLQEAQGLAQRYLREASSGFGIDVQNRSPARQITLKIKSLGGLVSALKSWSFDCRCVVFRDGLWRARVEPLRDLALTVEEPPGDALHLSIRVNRPGQGAMGAHELDHSVSFDDLNDGPLAWTVREDGTLDAVAAGTPVADGELRLTVGRRGRVGGAEVEVDDATRRQLEALGYL